jgi:hypothetical protein
MGTKGRVTQEMKGCLPPRTENDHAAAIWLSRLASAEDQDRSPVLFAILPISFILFSNFLGRQRRFPLTQPAARSRRHFFGSFIYLAHSEQHRECSNRNRSYVLPLPTPERFIILLVFLFDDHYV